MTAAIDVKNWTPVDAVATLAADAQVYKAAKAKEREGSRTAFAGVSQAELLRNQQRKKRRAPIGTQNIFDAIGAKRT
jgi:hypothetical protein